MTSLPLFPGARADVAVSCSGVGTATFASKSTATNNQPYYVGTIFTINVVASSVTATTIPSFSVYRPCYLSNTLTQTPSQTATTFAMTGMGGFKINGASFVSSTTYYGTLTTGTLAQMTVTGVAQHPFHIHVFPFQITSMTPGDATYFQVRVYKIFSAPGVFSTSLIP